MRKKQIDKQKEKMSVRKKTLECSNLRSEISNPFYSSVEKSVQKNESVDLLITTFLFFFLKWL